MPGIFGVVDSAVDAQHLASERIEIVERMAGAMNYDAAYTAEILSRPHLAVCAGYVGRPCTNPVNRDVPSTQATKLLIAGEPISANELMPQLERHGLEALTRVQGPVSGFVVDQPRGRCLLFTDRYGAERLFLHTDRGRLYFSSEAKAILAVAPKTRRLDRAGLAEWLTCGCTIGTQSLFHGIEILPAGSAIIFAPGRDAQRTRYFEPSSLENLPTLPPGEFVNRFTDTLRSAVSRSTEAPRSAAVSLTGGLDSRLVIAAIDAPPDSVPCYTFGSMYRRTMDVAVAQQVAAACRQPFHVLELDGRFLANVDEHFRHAVHVSDGYLGLAGAAELYLNQKAAAIAPIRVTGNWGGELMRGVRAFKWRMPKGEFIEGRLLGAMAEAEKTFARVSHGHSLSYTLFQQMPHQGFGRYAIERSQVTVRSPFLANTLVDLFYQAPAEVRGSIATVRSVLQRYPQLAAIPTDLGRLGTSSRAVSAIRQRYRRAMIKAEYLTSHGAPDWLAAVSSRVPLLERAFLGRDKFHHFRVWMRSELSQFVRDTVRQGSRVGIDEWFDLRRVSRMVDEHIAGQANHTDSIDKVLTLVALNKGFGQSALSHPPAAAVCVGS